MGVRENLALDHFYIGLPPEEFERLAPLTHIWKNCFCKKVQSGNDSWEGIYVLGRDGIYFEIVNDRRVHGFGIAFSIPESQDADASRIMQEMPKLLWKKGTRVDDKGSPWFDWITLGDYLDIHNTFFNAWIMNYHIPRRKGPRDQSESSIALFSKIHLTLGQAHLKTVQALSEWLPGNRLTESELLRFSVPGRNKNSFKVLIKLIPGESKFKFKRLEMEVPNGVEIKNHDLGALSLRQEGCLLYLDAKPENLPSGIIDCIPSKSRPKGISEIESKDI